VGNAPFPYTPKKEGSIGRGHGGNLFSLEKKGGGGGFPPPEGGGGVEKGDPGSGAKTLVHPRGGKKKKRWESRDPFSPEEKKGLFSSQIWEEKTPEREGALEEESRGMLVLEENSSLLGTVAGRGRSFFLEKKKARTWAALKSLKKRTGTIFRFLLWQRKRGVRARAPSSPPRERKEKKIPRIPSGRGEGGTGRSLLGKKKKKKKTISS